MTKNKPIYHARNVNRWKGSVEPRPFIGLLILDVINQFILGYGVVIYHIWPLSFLIKTYKTKDSETYCIRLSFSTNIPQSAFIRGWYFSKHCQKQAIFQVQIREWAFIRAWAFIRILTVSLNEVPHDRTNKKACAPSEDSDQPGHLPSLIRVFAVCSMGS